MSKKPTLEELKEAFGGEIDPEEGCLKISVEHIEYKDGVHRFKTEDGVLEIESPEENEDE